MSRRLACLTLIMPTALVSNAIAQGIEPLTTDQIRAIAAQAMSDAQTRTSLLATNAVGGHDGRFYLASADGAFRLNLGGYFQFRYHMNFGDDLDGQPDNDFESGFQMQRTRFMVSGKVNDSIEFFLLPAAGPNGSWSILDIWGRMKIGDTGWNVQWGQFKPPFWREWLLPERFNHSVERSDLTSVFAELYSQGVMLDTTTEQFRFYLAYTDGLRAANTNFTSPQTADYAITSRLEFMPFGKWGQFIDLTSLGNEDHGLLIGAAIHHQGQTDNFRGANLDRLTQYTLDINYEATNWSLTGAFVGRHSRVDGTTADDFGVLVNGGLFLTDKFELLGRYSVLIPDNDAAGDSSFNAVTAGFNYYLHGHAAKFTLDCTWYIDDPNNTTMLGFGPDTGTGLLATSGDNQVSIRAQFQLIF